MDFSVCLWLSLKFAFFCHFKLYEILFCSVKILVGQSLQLTWEKRAHTMVCAFLFVSDKNMSAEIVFLMQMYSCTTPLQQRWDILPQEKEELAQQIKRTRHYLKTRKISKVFGRIKSCGETLQSKQSCPFVSYFVKFKNRAYVASILLVVVLNTNFKEH